VGHGPRKKPLYFGDNPDLIRIQKITEINHCGSRTARGGGGKGVTFDEFKLRARLPGITCFRLSYITYIRTALAEFALFE